MLRPDDVLTLALDRSARTYDKDGRLHVAVSNISKANICGYYGREIPDATGLGLDPDKVYQLWRHPDELRNGAATANNLPLLDTHIIVSPDAPEQESVVGSTGTDALFADPYLTNSLVIWTDWAIEGVEKREVCQLSCAYRYIAVMTPGEHNGLHYDGIMRNIVFNHVALVPEGRAGPDVVVGDSLRGNASMPLTSRKALMARGALAVALRPIMATDAKVDLDAVLSGVNAKNFSSAEIMGRVASFTKGKLKSGVALDAVKAAMDAMEEEACDEDPEDKDDKDKDAKDAKRAKDRRARDRKASMDRMRARDSEEEETDEEKKDREAKDAAEDARRAKDGEEDESAKDWESRYEGDRKAARDAKAKDGQPKAGETPSGMDAKAVDRLVKAAVDQAITRTRDLVREDMHALDAARRDVAPYIGEITGAVDSARDIYVMALDGVDGIKLDGTESVSALRNMVALLPLPDAAPRREFALDSVERSTGFASRFPGAARIGHA